jgi:ligand-binding SRPBCC domain-containing protein
MTRKFGIDKGDLEYDFTDVKKFETEDSYWYITINKRQVRVRTSVLFDFNKFALAVFDQINIVLPLTKVNDWRKKLDEIGRDAQIEKLADDTTLDGRFDEHLNSFVNDLGKAQTIDEVAYGKCYHEDGYIYFKMKFLTQYLDKQRFRGYDPTRTASRLRELGADQTVRKADKKNNRMWKISAEAFERVAKLPVPDMESKEEDLPF